MNWYRAAARSTGLRAADTPAVSVPVCYVWGTADQTVGRCAAELTAEHVSGPYRFVEVAEAGHFLTDDVGASATRAAIVDHVRTHACSSRALVDAAPSATVAPRPRPLWPWLVAGAAFVALLGAGSFRAAPSVLIEPLQDDFGWSRGTISAAVMVNLILYGLTSPFAAALMDRFGMRASSCRERSR